MRAYRPNFFVSGPKLKFTNFLFNGEWNTIDNTVYRLSIFLCVPEIFVVKVKSFSTSHRILDVFPLQNFKKAVPLPKKIVPALSPNLKARQVAKYRGATPITPKVIGAHLLNYKVIFDLL